MGVNKSSYPKRAWYPSGPRLDGSRSDYSYPVSESTPDINPDPDKWEIQDAVEVGKALVVKIKYPNCINFEGMKILVFKDMTLLKLFKQKKIDPHFFKDSKYASPIARFIPTDEGWQMANSFAKLLLKDV